MNEDIEEITVTIQSGDCEKIRKEIITLGWNGIRYEAGSKEDTPGLHFVRRKKDQTTRRAT